MYNKEIVLRGSNGVGHSVFCMFLDIQDLIRCISSLWVSPHSTSLTFRFIEVYKCFYYNGFKMNMEHFGIFPPLVVRRALDGCV